MVLPDEYIALEFKGMSGAGAIEVDKNLTFRIRGLIIFMSLTALLMSHWNQLMALLTLVK